jgi:hypothetical protein
MSSPATDKIARLVAQAQQSLTCRHYVTDTHHGLTTCRECGLRRGSEPWGEAERRRVGDAFDAIEARALALAQDNARLRVALGACVDPDAFHGCICSECVATFAQAREALAAQAVPPGATEDQ